MRTIIWEINTMIVMRKTWYVLFYLHHSCIQEINIHVAAGQYKQASRFWNQFSIRTFEHLKPNKFGPVEQLIHIDSCLHWRSEFPVFSGEKTSPKHLIVLFVLHLLSCTASTINKHKRYIYVIFFFENMLLNSLTFSLQFLFFQYASIHVN